MLILPIVDRLSLNVIDHPAGEAVRNLAQLVSARNLLWSGLILGAFLSLVVVCFYLRDYALEQAELRVFLRTREHVVQSSNPLRIVEDLTGYISQLPDEETTAIMNYKNPLYRVLKARPLDVLRHGGFCGNKARLLVSLLEIENIPARISYIYNDRASSDPKIRQPYVTAFTEVDIGGRWIVADPLLGIVFRNVEGRPATALDLAENLQLVVNQAPHWYKTDVFDYQDIRGIRWSKFPAGEPIRDVLAALKSTRWVNALHYPYWVQRPNLVIAILAGTTFVLAILGLWSLLGHKPNRSTPADFLTHPDNNPPLPLSDCGS